MDGNASSGDQNMYQPETVVVPGSSNPDPDKSAEISTPALAAPKHKAHEQLEPGAIQWTASEFIAHHKTANWYVLSGLSALVVAVAIWLFTRDVFATTTVALSVLLLIVYAGRQPRQETYVLDSGGITIGARHYAFEEFRSFSALPEGAFLSIELVPLKRLAMYTTIYCAPADEERVLKLLSNYLPMEAPRNSLTDSLMRRIHF